LYYRYTIDQISHAVGSMKGRVPAEVTQKFCQVWIRGEREIFLDPDFSIESGAEAFQVKKAPKWRDLDGRGQPDNVEYAVSRSMFVNILIGGFKNAEETKLSQRKQLARDYPEKLERFYQDMAQIFNVHALTKKQLEDISTITLKASLTFRYCCLKWDEIPRPFKIQARELLTRRRKKGPKVGEKPKGEDCYNALVNLVVTGLYVPQPKDSRFASHLIKEIFEIDLDKDSIAVYLRNYLKDERDLEKLIEMCP
jgi:hypothetical protein